MKDSTRYTLLELFRQHRTPFLARHYDTRQMWRILGFGPGGDYIVGWIESNEKSDLIKLPPSAREWQYISSVGPSE